MVTRDLVFPDPPTTARCAHETEARTALPRRGAQGRIPGELHAALTDYTTYYREKTGQTIHVWSLMVQMLERFVETDRGFLA
jgi:Protein of unknown function (DUF2274)